MAGDGEAGADDSRAIASVARSLLEAIVGLGSDHEVELVLARVVESACRLTGARCGALAVAGGGGTIDSLIPYGVDEDAWQAHGFPPGHPTGAGFLGVPVRVRGTLFGHLYLTEKASGRFFTDADEEAVATLATAAGLAIDHARSLATGERQRRWLEAATRLGETVFPETPEVEALREVAAITRTMAGARAVAVATTAEGERPTLLVSDGPEADGLVTFLDEHPGAVSQALGGQERIVPATGDRTAMLIPLPARLARTAALLVLLDAGAPFLPPDLELVRSFADQAALTLDRAQGVRDREAMAVVSDRERIARDLHDVVIQRLFALGLTMQAAMAAPSASAAASVSVAPSATGVDPATVMLRVGEELDRTIADIRTTVFELQSTGHERLRSRLISLTRDYGRVLGFMPSMRSHGPIDTVTDDVLADDVLAVARESLSNVARHAEASSAWVELRATAETMLVVVGDDGRGLPATFAESGTRNLRERAERRGGTCVLLAAEEGGTVLRWQVPLRPPAG